MVNWACFLPTLVALVAGSRWLPLSLSLSMFVYLCLDLLTLVGLVMFMFMFLLGLCWPLFWPG